MTEDDRHQEFLENNREIAELERSLNCLCARKGRYMDKLSYMHDCLKDYLSNTALKSGGHPNPDYRKWPSEDELKKLFEDTQDAFTRLSRAKDRRTLL